MKRILAPLLLVGCAPSSSENTASVQLREPSAFLPELSAIEQRVGGTLGLVLIDAAGREVLTLNADRRMAFCSAFKFALGAAALDAAAEGEMDLAASVAYRTEDLPGHSPVLAQGDEMTSVQEAIEAAVTVSDNGAANIVIDAIGGPGGVTDRWRKWGDMQSRLDRRETGLNENMPYDVRDTSTASQMAKTLLALESTDILEPEQRAWLFGLGEQATTGLDRVRGGLPQGWNAGDKTGTCQREGSPNQQVNDIGWIDHPNGKDRYYFAVMIQRPDVPVAQAKAAMKDLGDVMARAIGY